MTDDELIKEGKALAKNFLEVPFLYKDKKKMRIICALVERLKAKSEIVEAQRKLIVWEDINPNDNKLVDEFNKALSKLNKEGE